MSKDKETISTIKPVKDRVIIDISREEALDLFRDLTTLEGGSTFFTTDLNLALRKFFGTSSNNPVEIRYIFNLGYDEADY